jgi:hypothetical protein
VYPRSWSLDELKADALTSIGVFVNARMGNLNPYPDILRESEVLFAEVFRITNDLRDMGRPAGWSASTIDAARFLGGSPISADDLKTIVKFGNPEARGAACKQAQLAVIAQSMDKARFPWIDEQREPTSEERHAAILTTSVVRAVERTRTYLRVAEGKRQEQEVVSCLASIGFIELDPGPPDLNDLSPGECVHGRHLWGKQCDVLARLGDKRFLAIECKASNSAVNSIKRVNDIADKATVWRRDRGEQVVTAAVLSGVHTPTVLEDAQASKHIWVFWEHNLRPLLDFVTSSGVFVRV